MRMRAVLTPRTLARYAVAWCYLAAFCVAEVVYALLPGRDQTALLAWASTNVHNIAHDPVGCMIGSAFFAQGALTAWPILIALAMFGANHVLGNWRTAVTCIAGHVIGTLVSEGILWYQILHHTQPASARFILDIGPSYIVVTAIAVGLIWGGWLVRSAAAIALAVLIFIGQIFSGLSRLQLSAVGHTTALLVGCTLGSFLAWQVRSASGAAGTPAAGASRRAGRGLAALGAAAPDGPVAAGPDGEASLAEPDPGQNSAR
jgi:hypothetical protein